jgi:hypothetical protein
MIRVPVADERFCGSEPLAVSGLEDARAGGSARASARDVMPDREIDEREGGSEPVSARDVTPERVTADREGGSIDRVPTPDPSDDRARSPIDRESRDWPVDAARSALPDCAGSITFARVPATRPGSPVCGGSTARRPIPFPLPLDRRGSAAISVLVATGTAARSPIPRRDVRSRPRSCCGSLARSGGGLPPRGCAVPPRGCAVPPRGWAVPRPIPPGRGSRLSTRPYGQPASPAPSAMPVARPGRGNGSRRQLQLPQQSPPA